MANKLRKIDATKPIFRRFDGEFVVKSIDAATRTIWHPITREVTDRMGDIVRIAGGDLSNFARKPAVLYGHDYQGLGKAQVPVIAKNIGFKVEGDTLYAGTQFLSPEGLSADLGALINDNWKLQTSTPPLLGWSIGFVAKEWIFVTDGSGNIVGIDFTKWELLEYSSVIIPAHQDAVNDAVQHGQVTKAVLELKPPGDEPEEPETNDSPKVDGTGIPAADPHANKQLENKQGENHNMNLDEILRKLEKGETLTAEDTAYLAKAKALLTPKAPEPPPAPVRKLDLSDGNGRTHVKKISEIMTLPSRYLNEEERAVRNFADDAVIIGTLLHKSPDQTKFWQDRVGLSSALRKAMDTATAAEGLEWVPTLLSANYIEKFRLAAKVAPLFTDLPMPSNPFKIPYTGGLGAANFYLVGESISDAPVASPPSTMATGAQTLTARKLKARVYFSEELTEASVVPILPHLREEMVTAGAEAIDDCIINGDTTVPHMDSDVVDSKDRRKIWDGLRDQCPSGTKVDLGTYATATLLSIRTKMGKYGITPSDLALITSPVGYNKLVNLAEVLTVDKYGPAATILNGELAKIGGIPIIVSEAVRENLNASGVYDGTTMTKTEQILVNRRTAWLGSWLGVKITYKEEAEVDQNQLIIRFYKALGYRWTPSATVTTIGLAYNIA